MKQESLFPPLQVPVTICVLCYGNHAFLIERLLISLLNHTDPEAFRLRIGINAPGPATLEVLGRLLPKFSTEMVIRSDVNIFKIPMMRRLFHEKPITTDWTLWFDDDSYVFRDDWMFMLRCENRLRPQIAMWGQKFFIRGGEAHRQFIQAAPWYRNVELMQDEQPGTYRLSFVVGGYWAIRTIWLQRLDWPESRLLQFGDDYILGEALRQHGAPLGIAYSGVAINKAPRRAPPGTPRSEVLW